MLGGQTLRNVTVTGVLVKGSWIMNHLRTFWRCFDRKVTRSFETVFDVTTASQKENPVCVCVDKAVKQQAWGSYISTVVPLSKI